MIFMNDIKIMTLLDALWKKYVILTNVIETITQGQFANIYEASHTAMRLYELRILFLIFWVIIKESHQYFWIKILFHLILKLFKFLFKNLCLI